MSDEEVLISFAEGFAKVAEDAGFYGEQVRGLMELSMDLAQGAVHKEAFDHGFSEALGRA